MNRLRCEAYIQWNTTQPKKRMTKMPFPEIIILGEVSQKENDKYHMISLICGI